MTVHPLVAAVLVGRMTVLKGRREFQAVRLFLPMISEGNLQGNFLCTDEEPAKQG